MKYLKPLFGLMIGTVFAFSCSKRHSADEYKKIEIGFEVNGVTVDPIQFDSSDQKKRIFTYYERDGRIVLHGQEVEMNGRTDGDLYGFYKEGPYTVSYYEEGKLRYKELRWPTQPQSGGSRSGSSRTGERLPE